MEAEADRLAMENEVMEERLKGATATDTYQISKEMQSLLDLQVSHLDPFQHLQKDAVSPRSPSGSCGCSWTSPQALLCGDTPKKLHGYCHNNIKPQTLVPML